MAPARWADGGLSCYDGRAMTRVLSALVLLVLNSAPAGACSDCVRTISLVPEPVTCGLAWALMVGLAFYRGPLARLVLVSCVLAFGLRPAQEMMRLHPEQVLALLMVPHVFLFVATRDRSRLAIKLGLLGCNLLGLLVLLQVPRVYFDGKRCGANLQYLRDAIGAYRDDTGAFPRTLRSLPMAYDLPRCYSEDLAAPFENPHLSLRQKEILARQWCVNFGDYGYQVVGNEFQVWCPGQNHKGSTAIYYGAAD